MNVYRLLVLVGMICLGGFVLGACTGELPTNLPGRGEPGGDQTSPVRSETGLLSANRSRVIRGDANEGHATLTFEVSAEASYQWFACILDGDGLRRASCSDRPVVDLLGFDLDFQPAEDGVSYTADGGSGTTVARLRIMEVIGDPGPKGAIVRITAVATFGPLADEEEADNADGEAEQVLSDITLLVVRPEGALAVSVTSLEGTTIEPGQQVTLTAVVTGGTPFETPGGERPCPEHPTLPGAPPCDVFGGSEPPNSGEPYEVTWAVQGLSGGSLSVPCLCVQDELTVSTAVYTAPIDTGNVTFSVEATDATGVNTTSTLSLRVAPKNELAFTVNAEGTVLTPGQTIGVSAEAAGGLPPYTIALENTAQAPRVGFLLDTAPDPDTSPVDCGEDEGRSQLQYGPLPAGDGTVQAYYRACPNRTGSDVITARLTDGLGVTLVRTIPVTIASPLDLNIEVTSEFGIVFPGETVDIEVAVDGGTPPYKVCYFVDAGRLSNPPSDLSDCEPITIGETEFENCTCPLGDLQTAGFEQVFDSRRFTTPVARDSVPVRVAVIDAVDDRATASFTIEVTSQIDPGGGGGGGGGGGPSPVNITLTAGDANLCLGEETIITANVSGGAGDTEVTFPDLDNPAPGESLQKLSDTTARYTAPTEAFSRQITVTVTDEGGGSDNDAIVITTQEPPDATIDADDVCPNSSGNTASVPSAGTGAAYSWSVSGGTITAGQSQRVVTYDAGDGPDVTLDVTVTSGAGCTNSDQKTVDVLDLPDATITAATTVCQGSTGNPAEVLSAGSGADCLWEIVGGTITSGQGSCSINYTVGFSSEVTLTVTVTDAAGCENVGTTDPSIQTQPNPTVNAGTDFVACETGSAQLSGSATEQSSVLWSKPADSDGSFDDPTVLDAVFTPGPNDIARGNVVLTLTAQPIAPCAAAISDNVLITFQRPPSADAGADRDTCGGAAVQLNGGASHYAGVAWTTDGDGTFNPDPATVLNPTYAPGEGDIAAGSVTLTLTATAVAPCDAEAADDMVLTIAAGPTSDAGPDQGLCYAQGQTPQVALNGSATEYSSVLWTTSGTGFFNNNTILNPVYTPSAADVASGNVTLTLTANPIAPCTSPAQNDMVATFQIEPTVEAGESQSICGQQPVSVSGTAAAFSSVQWTTSGTGSFADPDSLTTVYTPGTEDVDAGSVILTLTANPIAPCADAVSDDLTVTIQDSGVIAGDLEPSADQRVCPNDSAFFRVPVEGVPADYTYTWQFDADRDGVFETTLVDDGVITGTGTYTITINPASDIHEGLYRCIVDSACPGETSNTASLRVNPTIGDVTVDPADGNPCEDDVVIFAAIDVQAKPGVQIFYQWRLGGTAIPGAQSDTLVLDPVTLGDAGDYTVRVTTSCGGEVISDPITLTVAPAPTAEAGNPQTICADASASLSGASATDYAAVLWTTAGDGTFIDATVLNAVYTPGSNDIAAGSVELTLTADAIAPCTTPAADTVTITIQVLPTAEAGDPQTICADESAGLSGSATEYATLLWATAGDGTFDDATVLDPVYTPGTNDLAAGSVVLTLTANPIAPCATPAADTVTVTIQALPTVEAGTPQTICGDGSASLAGSATEYATVLWTTAGDGTFDDASVLNAFYTPGSNDTAAGSVELTLTANAVDPCVDSVADTVMISIQPAPTVEAGDAQTICADASASLSGSATDYATVSWTTGGDGTFDFPSELDPVYTPGSSDLAAGSVVLTLTANPVAPCATPAADTVTITIQALPTAEAGDAQTICEDASASLSGSATDYATVSWTTGGDGTFDFATELDPLYTPGLSDLTAGSVVLTLTANPMAPCATTAADTVTITIQALPTVEAGDPQTICGDASASLSGLATDYATVLWSTAGDGTFDDATVLNAVYTPGTNDIAGGGVVLTLTANPMAPCATTAADTVTISIQALPTVEAGDAQTICGDASASLSGSATDYATVLWTTGGDGMFDDATVLDPVYTPGSSDIEGGSVELTLTANAVGPCVGSVADTVMITIQPAPAAEAGDPQTICAGETAGLTGQASDYLDVLWTTPGDGTFDDASALNAVYTPGSSDITAGSVVLTLTANPITPCATPEVDTVTITIQALPVPVITGDPLEACDFTTVTLDAGVFDGYLWSTGETTQTIDVTVTGPISGKWSESFVGGEPGGLGNVVHAASAEGLLLGGEWEVTGPTLVDAVEIENTVDGQGNGYIILQTTYDGGTLYVDPELWGADGSMITADIQDYIHTTTFFYVSYEADLPASWTDVSFTATSLDGPELAVTGIATYLNQGTGMPTSWPEFLGGVNEGQWGFMHALTIGVTYDVTVTLGVCEGTDSIVVTADALPDCTITAPITIPAGSGGHVASVRNAGAGAIYTWDLIGNGTIDQDYGYLIEFSSTGTAGDVLTLTVTVELANGCTDTCFADVSVTGG